MGMFPLSKKCARQQSIFFLFGKNVNRFSYLALVHFKRVNLLFKSNPQQRLSTHNSTLPRLPIFPNLKNDEARFMQAYTQLSDKDLLALYLAGNTAPLHALITRHQQKVFTAILLLVKDRPTAEDIFQDTWVKVIDTLHTDRYTENGKFSAWVMRIAHNLCIDHFRRAKKMPTITTEDGTDVFEFLRFADDENAEDRLMRRQTNTRLHQMIDHLPEEQREVLVMRHYHDMSFKEIATITNVSINTALGRMRYALNNLRKMMRQNEIVL